MFVKAGLKIEMVGIQRYSIKNMFSWRLTNKPQINNPTFSLDKEYEWMENMYKKKLEIFLILDTIIGIGQK